MSPEQPQNTPSTDAQPSDAAVADSGSDAQQEKSSPGWWQRLFSRGTSEETSNASGDSINGTDRASQPLSLTPEELDRRIQAETDRREAKRAADARKQAKLALRDKDPFAYVDLEKQEEQAAETSTGVQQFFANVGTAHDRVAIDPLVETLPKAERDRILALEGAGTGLAGRKLVVTEALKALEKHWKAEGEKTAEARLRRNPAFRKQVLNEGRANAVEPELLPGAASNGADREVSSILRNYYHMG